MAESAFSEKSVKFSENLHTKSFKTIDTKHENRQLFRHFPTIIFHSDMYKGSNSMSAYRVLIATNCPELNSTRKFRHFWDMKSWKKPLTKLIKHYEKYYPWVEIESMFSCDSINMLHLTLKLINILQSDKSLKLSFSRKFSDREMVNFGD